MLSTFFCALLLQASPEASISALAWMSGKWVGRSGELGMEEAWLAPAGGLMLGVHRDIQGGKAVNYELLRIESLDGTLVYTSVPNGKSGTAFRLVSLSGERVVFENPQHDFPQRILYWRPRAEELCARIEGVQGGKVVGEQWCWRRPE